jgi:hypothetical protein
MMYHWLGDLNVHTSHGVIAQIVSIHEANGELYFKVPGAKGPYSQRYKPISDLPWRKLIVDWDSSFYIDDFRQLIEAHIVAEVL